MQKLQQLVRIKQMLTGFGISKSESIHYDKLNIAISCCLSYLQKCISLMSKEINDSELARHTLYDVKFIAERCIEDGEDFEKSLLEIASLLENYKKGD